MYKIIISGGGTGGHIFPAIAIANTIKEQYPDVEILFVGAKGRMEMDRVPQAGYPIIGLPISGFNRKNIFKNIPVLLGLLKSMIQSKKIIQDFAPDAAVGVGGYASGPLLQIANKKGIPTLILEPNSYPGVTNRLLAKEATVICVGVEGMERFFPLEKIVVTGSPVRSSLFENQTTREEALRHFNLDPSKKTVLLIGGSLGARSLNNALKAHLAELCNHPTIQLIWQCGNYYHAEMQSALKQYSNSSITLLPFISEMNFAYAAVDVIISRSGAGTISELCHVAKPSILVPSPNVAEDHQTVNAMALVDRKAALLVRDMDAVDQLIPTTLDLLDDPQQCALLSRNIHTMAQYDSDKRIVDQLVKIIAKRNSKSPLD